ncbi:hypothetical protein AURDEDRAFT_167803 [Auricularia subglabra TFB-10046 SS5]|nr:hypothetical protein AURDEDRAFT_167803 [Auricularia subglabra TFB-10046 SS5]
MVLKQSRFTNLIVPADVFHLALLEREQFNELTFEELDAKSLEYYDYGEHNWKSLEHQTAIQLLPTTRTLLLRAESRFQSFPPRYIRRVAFKKAFPDYDFDAREFRVALDLWSSTPHDVQTVFKDAGRTEGGLWADLVKDGDRRRRVAAAQRRRSTVPPAVQKVSKQEIIIIDDD